MRRCDLFSSKFPQQKARKKVQSVRLTYDAFRARVKSARPEHADAARQEMEAAEDEFVAAVDEAMGKMKIVVESPEPLKCLADLVAIQLQYFKVCLDLKKLTFVVCYRNIGRIVARD